ncbi:MAG TPA: OB-fold nucleic acid binding domain-containing protein, partial [Geobacteraceae bacterium]|nr:OB-fold nucleic acid binding domain-containing protein [Geobacteraceae bacterium]
IKPQAVTKNEEAVKDAHGGKSLAELKGKEAPSIPAIAPVADNVKVEKATGPNAYTVAELYEKKDTLDNQKVVIRGKVVKVSSGIMGKTWVHLRDGSGSAEQMTNNLVVTTQDVPDVGDVVTASGTMHKDKDFWAGYLYALIMEEASLLK